MTHNNGHAMHCDCAPALAAHTSNPFGQPIGLPLREWQGASRIPRQQMQGRLCRLEPMDMASHAAQLFAAFAEDAKGANWTYLPYGPFVDETDFRAGLSKMSAGADPQLFAIVDAGSDCALGFIAYLRIEPEHGCIELGHVHFSPRLQGSAMATKAFFLMMQQAFSHGYRRLEWKCDALNAPSRAAARRLGFCFEGVFRQARVIKGRNRDTAWFSLIDQEWPALREQFERWLAAENFDAAGRQRLALSALTRALRGA